MRQISVDSSPGMARVSSPNRVFGLFLKELFKNCYLIPKGDFSALSCKNAQGLDSRRTFFSSSMFQGDPFYGLPPVEAWLARCWLSQQRRLEAQARTWLKRHAATTATAAACSLRGSPVPQFRS